MNLVGHKYGIITVVSFSHKKNYEVFWNCICECGKEIKVRQQGLRSGNTKSCGCTRNNKIKNLNKSHGQSKCPEYSVWSEIKNRCYNQNNSAYKNYGGRGIKMHSEWINSYESFISYVGKRPTSSHSIDRYPDNNGNYEPGNVRWATRKQQIENRRNSIFFIVNGERITIKDIADKFNVRYQTIIQRVNRGWPIERILSTPVKHFISGETVSKIVKSKLNIAQAAKVFGLSDSEISYIRIRERKKSAKI